MNFNDFILSKTVARDLYIETLHDPQVSDTFDHFMLSTKDEVIKEMALPDFSFSHTTGFGPVEATDTEISAVIKHIDQTFGIYIYPEDLFDFINERYMDRFENAYQTFLHICQTKSFHELKNYKQTINNNSMSTKNVNLQFCGWAKKIQGTHGEFWSMELNKEQLGKIISEFQNENGFVDLSIAEKKQHKEDEKNTHYVYSNVRYQDGQDTSSEINIRIDKTKLAEVPTKEEHRAYIATISPVDKEKMKREGKESKTDFSVYIKDQDTEKINYIGAGWDIKAQRTAEQTSSIDICGSANLKEKDSKPFYSITLNKEKLQNLFDVLAGENFLDLTLAEKKEHTEGEKTGYYIYPSLKYQGEKDNNPKSVMTLRIFKDEFLKAKAFNTEHSILAGVFPRDKEKDAADGKEIKSDHTIVANKPDDKDNSVFLGAGFNLKEKASQLNLKEGDPVHIKVNDPVLKEFIGHTEQAAFGYLIAMKGESYKVHCCCGTYWVNQNDIKPATIENVSNFDKDYQDMRTRLNQEKSTNTGKSRTSKKGKAVENSVNIKDEPKSEPEMPF